MPEFETATGTIFYEVLGPTKPDADGQCLTLLHNFMSTGRAAWGPMLDTFAAEYRVLLPDLPGHGQSVGHPFGFDHGQIAHQLAEFMTHEGATEGHLAGCSSGGMLAQLLVHKGLMTPATLTLISTTHSVEPATTGDSARLLPENFAAGRAWMEATAALHDPFHYDGYYEEIILASFRRLTGQSAIDLPLAALSQWPRFPICLIHGAEDEFFPPSIPARMAATLPDAELHIIPAQSHALIFRRPWQVAELMFDFLQRHSSAGTGEPRGIPTQNHEGGNA